MNARTRIAGIVVAALVVVGGATVYAVAGGGADDRRKAAFGSVSYPDYDLVKMKTTGGFLGENNPYAVDSFMTSYINWNSTKSYRQFLYLVDEVGDGRCMGVWAWGTDATTGKAAPAVKLGEACLPQGRSGTVESTLYQENVMAPTGFTYKSLTIKLCRLAVDKNSTDSCVTQVVQPGFD